MGGLASDLSGGPDLAAFPGISHLAHALWPAARVMFGISWILTLVVMAIPRILALWQEGS